MNLQPNNFHGSVAQWQSKSEIFHLFRTLAQVRFLPDPRSTIFRPDNFRAGRGRKLGKTTLGRISVFTGTILSFRGRGTRTESNPRQARTAQVVALLRRADLSPANRLSCPQKIVKCSTLLKSHLAAVIATSKTGSRRLLHPPQKCPPPECGRMPRKLMHATCVLLRGFYFLARVRAPPTIHRHDKQTREK